VQRCDIRGRISPILIIFAGACECPFRDVSSRPLQQSPADRRAFVGKGNDLRRRRNCDQSGHAWSPGTATRYFSGSLSFSEPLLLLIFAIDALQANDLPIAATPSEEIRAAFGSPPDRSWLARRDRCRTRSRKSSTREQPSAVKPGVIKPPEIRRSAIGNLPSARQPRPRDRAHARS
jgi:hypothetical protein